MKPNIKFFLPNDDNIINAIIVNTSNGEARYISFDDAVIIKKYLKNNELANVETFFLDIGETQDIELEEDKNFTYHIEVIPKRKGIKTPPAFKDYEHLYEIVLDKHYKENTMENDTQESNNKKQSSKYAPEKELEL